MPSVSVILPTRDRPSLLPRAIASVLAQTERDLELIVVDQNREVPPVRQAAGGAEWLRDPRVRIIEPGLRRNAAEARNAGLDAATGQWIGFLDDDDAYRPAKIARQLAAAARTGASVVLCGACYHLTGRTRIKVPARRELRGDDLLLTEFGPPFLLHRRRPDVRFDDTLDSGEDAVYAQALLAAVRAESVACVEEPLVDVHQDRLSPDRTNLRSEEAWRAARRLWWVHGRRYSRSAQRVFVARALTARAKGRGDLVACAKRAWLLLRCGGLREARFAANAVLVASGVARGRWVT